jgi:hypothetical protein
MGEGGSEVEIHVHPFLAPPSVHSRYLDSDVLLKLNPEVG